MNKPTKKHTHPAVITHYAPKPSGLVDTGDIHRAPLLERIAELEDSRCVTCGAIGAGCHDPGDGYVCMTEEHGRMMDEANAEIERLKGENNVGTKF